MAASSCETITAASGRTLVIGLNASGRITSVTDPMSRNWTYAYSGGELTSGNRPDRQHHLLRLRRRQ